MRETMRKYQRTIPKLDPVAIGLRVRTLRTKSGWKQRELAERSGVNAAVIGAIETGARLPSREAAIALGVVFRRSLQFILFGLTGNGKLWKLNQENDPAAGSGEPLGPQAPGSAPGD